MARIRVLARFFGPVGPPVYVKIPHFTGENNINLTMEYVQEEDPTHKFEEKEEDNKQFFY